MFEKIISEQRQEKKNKKEGWEPGYLPPSSNLGGLKFNQDFGDTSTSAALTDVLPWISYLYFELMWEMK